jgi:hypothetical protein
LGRAASRLSKPNGCAAALGLVCEFFGARKQINGDKAQGFAAGASPNVWFVLKAELADEFLHEFGEADRMWVKFGVGNEEPCSPTG